MPTDASGDVGDHQRTVEFVRLLSQHERRVTLYIFSAIANWADAEDIRQEMNVTLWKEFDKYEPGTDFGAWAVTIARFRVLAYRERNKRDRLQFSQEFVDVVATEVEERADGSVRAEALAKCVENLGRSSRAFVRRCYMDGLQVKDLAREFGYTQAAAYKALSRARAKLYKCIEQRVREERHP